MAEHRDNITLNFIDIPLYSPTTRLAFPEFVIFAGIHMSDVVPFVTVDNPAKLYDREYGKESCDFSVMQVKVKQRRGMIDSTQWSA